MTNDLEVANKAGIDLSLIEENLRLTPEQRLLQHQSALDMLVQLQSAYSSTLSRTNNDHTQQSPPKTV